MGVQGTLRAPGDLSVRAGRGTLLVAAEMLRESLGLPTRAANMVERKVIGVNNRSREILENVWCPNKWLRDRL